MSVATRTTILESAIDPRAIGGSCIYNIRNPRIDRNETVISSLASEPEEANGRSPRTLGDRPNDGEWIARLTSTGPARDSAVAHLHELLLRATRHQVSRMPEAIPLGAALRDEIIHSSADHATLSVLGKLDDFEGRSKFTTWAYKFGILRAGVEVRRSVWRDRDVRLSDVAETREHHSSSPEAQAEGRDLASAVQQGLNEALTDHQRKVAIALLIQEIPIDVLADHMGTTRNALYKSLHDARKKLRAYLIEQGYPQPGVPGTASTTTTTTKEAN